MNVAVKWKQVGAQLNFDPIGNYLNIIEADRGKEGVESCCQTMFQHWLKGSGEQPATWGKLLEVLKDCGFLVLASDLEKALKSRKVSARISCFMGSLTIKGADKEMHAKWLMISHRKSCVVYMHILG